MYSSNQQKIAERIDPETLKSNWKDWEWQIGHSIRDIDTVERLLGIQFPADRREELEETIARFPLCITPYYLSLIEAGDYDNDPVFMQAFPSISELIVEEYDLPDPLAEDADSPVPASPTDTYGRSSSGWTRDEGWSPVSPQARGRSQNGLH
ncbi:hypothetical protein [Methanovulcanius yangii]|uniref:hypothetical protein n=1 Tax=Methanovulcanius yangii TaxID=1789227 RepID=UPI0029CA8C40|nr:hypothetical protein [Methanovulcanius yangii]